MTPERPEATQVALLVIEALTALGVRYHLGGSYASSVHGIPRQTQDIDLVAALTPDTAAALVRRLAAQFYADEESARDAARARRSFNLVHLDSGIKVDLFVLGDSSFDREEFEYAVPITDDQGNVVVVKSAEHTILRKLLWYRAGGEVSERQWADVVGIVDAQGDRLNIDLLRRWGRELEIEDLLARALGPSASSGQLRRRHIER